MYPRLPRDYPMVSASSLLGLQVLGGLPHPIYDYLLRVHAIELSTLDLCCKCKLPNYMTLAFPKNG